MTKKMLPIKIGNFWIYRTTGVYVKSSNFSDLDQNHTNALKAISSHRFPDFLPHIIGFDSNMAYVKKISPDLIYKK